MTELKFKGFVKPMQQLADEVLNGQHKFKLPYQDKFSEQRGVWMVKDNGIYIMNAHKRKGGNIVVYADGYNPDLNDDWWEDCRDAVGGDDFAEFIPLGIRQLMRIINNKDPLYIELTETEIKISV